MQVDSEKFVVAWQSAASAGEAAQSLGITLRQAVSKAWYLRSRGVPLKKYTPQKSKYDIPYLAELARSLN